MCLEGPGSLVTPVVPGMGAAPLSAYGAANVVGGTPVYGTSHLSLILPVLSPYYHAAPSHCLLL